MAATTITSIKNAIKTTYNQTFFKLYVSDVGLLRNMAKVPPGVIMSNTDQCKEFKGALTENYALNEIINTTDDNVYFWRSGSKVEIDFVFQEEDLIIPMEVKSEKNDRSKSLIAYISKYSPEVSLKATMKNTTDNNISLYLLWRLRDKILSCRG